MRNVCVAALVFGVALGARANDVELELSPSVPVGKQPTVTVKVKKDLRSCTLDVRSVAGRAHQRLGPKERGGELVFTLPQKRAGKASWKGSLSVVFDDGTSGSMPLAFATEVLSGFRFAVKEVKLEERSITFTSEHDTQKIDVAVYGDDGKEIATTSQDFGGAKAGTPLTVSWTPLADGPVLRIHTVITDTSTATQSSDSFPYNISIPHEEVEFETGKADVRASEEPKLNKALPELETAIKRYSTAVKVTGASIKLFVSGFTDTVGSSSSNHALSERRAEAIARWFANKGVKVAIYARGFGEDLLKVDTPDETDEQKNRRADYDVGVDGPTGSLSAWTRIR